MSGYSIPKIFLSYSWANKEIADEIDADFKCLGIKLTRDIRDFPYGRSIVDFTQSIIEHDYLLTVISDDFLKSENCMLELAVLLNSMSDKVGILPLLLDSAKQILKLEGRTYYYHFWSSKLSEASAAHEKLQNLDSFKNVRNIKNINGVIDAFFLEVMKNHTQTLGQLRSEKYQQLLGIINFNEDRFIDEVSSIEKIVDKEEKANAIKNILLKFSGTSLYDFYQAYFTAEKGDFEAAKDNYITYINKYKDNPVAKLGGAYNNLAALQEANLNDHTNAFLNYKEAIRHSATAKSKAWRHNNLGNLLLTHFKDIGNAKSHFKEALNLDPLLISARSRLARILEENDKDYKGSEWQLREIIRLDPNNNAHYYLARLLQNHCNDFRGSKTHFLETLRLYPQDPKVHYELAVLLHNNLEEYDEALLHYKEAIRLDNRLADAHFEMGMLYDKHFKNFGKALEHFKAVLQINPSNSAAHNNIGTIYFNGLGDFEKARYHFQEAVRLDPDNQTARNNLSLVNKTKKR
jgi:tetratricopeptide (TPR) repeat protein